MYHPALQKAALTDGLAPLPSDFLFDRFFTVSPYKALGALLCTTLCSRGTFCFRPTFLSFTVQAQRPRAPAPARTFVPGRCPRGPTLSCSVFLVATLRNRLLHLLAAVTLPASRCDPYGDRSTCFIPKRRPGLPIYRYSFFSVQLDHRKKNGLC